MSNNFAAPKTPILSKLGKNDPKYLHFSIFGEIHKFYKHGPYIFLLVLIITANLEK